MKNVLKPLAKRILIPLGLAAAASAADAIIHKNILRSGLRPAMLVWQVLDLANQIILKIPDKEMDDIMKIVKSCQESGLLSASLLGNLFKGKKWKLKYLDVE